MSAEPAIERLQERWDSNVRSFLDGNSAVPDGLTAWAESYQGRGKGEVEWNALPEPYLGDLSADVKGVFLALNPGKAALPFQGRDGIFASEIERVGSYREWAASWAYMRDPWVAEIGTNRHHRSRLKFLRSWLDDSTLGAEAMVGFELYPWHSTAVTGKMTPPAETVREWVWEPIAELGAPVFAFGAPWFDILEHGLGLTVVDRLGAGGREYGSSVKSRAVVILRDEATGVVVLVEKHSGGAGPPSYDEMVILQNAVAHINA